jgi:hypothetical protein
MQRWWHGRQDRRIDPAPLLALSPEKNPCAGCEAFTSALTKRKRQGWYVDGSYRNTGPAHTGAWFEVRTRFAEGSYRLLSFTVS